jgi:hypothetical protein
MNVFSLEEAKQKEIEIDAGSHRINIKQVKVFEVKENQKLLLLFLNNGLRGTMGKLGFT